MHLRQPQPAAAVRCRREPLANLLAVRGEPRFGVPGRRRLAHGLEPLPNARGERLIRCRRRGVPPRGPCHADVASHRLARVARRTLDRGVRLAAVDPPQDLQNLPHANLPIRHPCPSSGAQDAEAGFGTEPLRRSRPQPPPVGQGRENSLAALGHAREKTAPWLGHRREKRQLGTTLATKLSRKDGSGGQKRPRNPGTTATGDGFRELPTVPASADRVRRTRSRHGPSCSVMTSP